MSKIHIYTNTYAESSKGLRVEYELQRKILSNSTLAKSNLNFKSKYTSMVSSFLAKRSNSLHKLGIVFS